MRLLLDVTVLGILDSTIDLVSLGLAGVSAGSWRAAPSAGERRGNAGDDGASQQCDNPVVS